jgi:hypothetical protein
MRNLKRRRHSPDRSEWVAARVAGLARFREIRIKSLGIENTPPAKETSAQVISGRRPPPAREARLPRYRPSRPHRLRASRARIASSRSSLQRSSRERLHDGERETASGDLRVREGVQTAVEVRRIVRGADRGHPHHVLHPAKPRRPERIRRLDRRTRPGTEAVVSAALEQVKRAS